MHLLELKDLSKYYHTGEVITLGLRKVNMSFDIGEFVAVVGESGSGKSTLMNVISGMDTFEEGEMYYKGEETSCFTADEWVSYRKNNISFIFQDYNLIDSYTVFQNVELALFESFPDKKQRKERALELIDKVGLSSHIRHKCTKLSGGQKQRVAIARALAKDAPIIIADEPTGNLDEATGKSIIELLNNISRDKLLIMVTHNYEDVKDYTTRKIRLYDGSVAEDRKVRDRDAAGETETKIDKAPVKFGVKVKNYLTIARNNVLSAPKKSLFVFSAMFLSSIIFIFYFLFAFNNLLMSSEKDSFGNRKDTAIVYKSGKPLLTESDKKVLLSVTGVEEALLHYGIYNLNTYGYSVYTPETLFKDMPEFDSGFYGDNILTLANINKKKVNLGRFPEKDDEVLIGYREYYNPDPEVLDITVSFQFGGDNTVYKEYTIAGFVTAEENGIFLRASEIESLSKEHALNVVPNNFTVHSDSFSIYGVLRDSFKVTEDIELNEAYLVYDEERTYRYYDKLYELINYFNSGEEEINITVYKETGTYLKVYKVKCATKSKNPEIFNEYYENAPILLVNSKTFFYTEEYAQLSNSVAVILDEDYPIATTIASLRNKGYNVVYYYGNSGDYEYIIMVMLTLMQAVLIGLIMLLLGAIILTEVLKKTLASKNKDINILRTLGYDNKTIKFINYSEFILTNLASFFTVFILITAVYYIALLSDNIKFISAMYAILPYGAFHYLTLASYAISLFIVVVQSFIILRRYNKKMKKRSIKQALSSGEV